MSTGQNLWQCVDIMTFYSSSQPRRKEATIGILSERQPRQKNNKFKTSPEFDIFGLKFASKRDEPCECFLTPEAWRCHCRLHVGMSGCGMFVYYEEVLM